MVQLAEMTDKEKLLVSAGNILVGLLVAVDLFVIAGIIEADLPTLTLTNLLVTLIALAAFRVKRRIKQAKQAARQPSPPPAPSQEPRSGL